MKTHIRYILILSLLMPIAFLAKAQVGINNPNPDPSSVLDLSSENSGLLIPRMTSLQRLAISDPASGLLVFDTDEEMFYFYNPSNTSRDPSLDNAPWQALSGYTYIDQRGYKPFGTDLRTIRTHRSVKDINFFQDITGDFTQGEGMPRLFIGGQILVSEYGANQIPRPEGNYGIAVQGKSRFHDVVTFDEQPVFSGGLPQETGDIGELITSDPDDPSIDPNDSDTWKYQQTFTGYGTIPKGGIIMWSGTLESLPPGWALCDGETTYDDELGVERTTPDLKDRFIVSAGGFRTETFEILGIPISFETGYDVDSIGGDNRVTLTIDEMPGHQHDGVTSTDGNHNHSWSDTFATDEDGNGTNSILLDAENDGTYSRTTTTDGDHAHNVILNNTGGGQSHENRPAFYALAFIIRVQ